jgi:quercetin dioxygenase-like cupin family protein
MRTPPNAPSLDGWDIRHAGEAPWLPWGSGTGARARILGEADGYTVALVEAGAGYRGLPHEHAHAEFLYLAQGALRTQGRAMHAGDAYAAAAGSVHDDFEATAPATYLSIFRV